MSVHSLNPTAIGSSLEHELLVVVPVFNEEATIEEVIAEWESSIEDCVENFAFLIINDGSTDRTQEILERLESQCPDRFIIVRKPNSGHGNSCRVGYDIACASNCSWVLQIDSDGQCDPRYFEAFWQARNSADCVFGVRKSRDDGWARMATSRICRWGSSLICGVDLKDPNVPYRLLSRIHLTEALGYIPPGFNIHNVALSFTIKRLGRARCQHLPIHFRDRQGGSNSINLWNVAQWGIDMLLELSKLKSRVKPE